MQNMNFCDQISIFSLALLPYGFASCGEDGTVRVWKGSLSFPPPSFLSYLYSPFIFSQYLPPFFIIIYSLSLSPSLRSLSLQIQCVLK